VEVEAEEQQLIQVLRLGIKHPVELEVEEAEFNVIQKQLGL
jgi:hypothetical protein